MWDMLEIELVEEKHDMNDIINLHYFVFLRTGTTEDLKLYHDC